MSQEAIDDVELDLAAAIGAVQDDLSTQVLTVYVPNKDRDGKEFGSQRKWVLETAALLALIGDGFTIMPPVEGGWLNPDTREIIWENPVLVYTFVRAEKLRERLGDLKDLIHRIGRETNQGEVVIDFDGELYRIKSFD